MPFKITEIDYLHLEISNNCNAICPACPRYLKNSPYVKPGLKLNSWTIDDFKRYLPKEIFTSVSKINFCGNHGDPLACKDFVKIIQYLDEIGYVGRIEVHTNGGLKNESYWKQVGEVFSKHDNWKVIFSIDGLEDTNHLYRRNVKWDTVIRNAKAYNSITGAVSTWEYLIFKHNEHQIKEASKLSIKMGFRYFIPKKTLNLDNGEHWVTIPAINKEGKTDYHLYPPIERENKNGFIVSDKIKKLNQEFNPAHLKNEKKLREGDLIYKGRSTWEEYDKPINPKCKTKHENTEYSSLYIDANGFVSPCCWIDIHTPVMLHMDYDKSTPNLAMFQLYDKYEKIGGIDKLNLNKNDLQKILYLIEELFENSWSSNPSCGKTIWCTQFCGPEVSIDQLYTHKGKMRNVKA